MRPARGRPDPCKLTANSILAALETRKSSVAGVIVLHCADISDQLFSAASRDYPRLAKQPNCRDFWLQSEISDY